MKALFFNGSPRKGWNTFKMLESAMKGAQDAGAEAKMIQLYDASFKGCVSCFACKLKNAKTNGLCAYKDALTPILEKTRDADVIVIGSPVYFSHATGVSLAFMERLLFPWLTYNPRFDESGNVAERGMTTLDRVVPTAMIYTMGDTEEHAKEMSYPSFMKLNELSMQAIFGYCETLASYCAYQFSDYSKYEVWEALEPPRARRRVEGFPKDLQKAYELGKRLVEKARLQ